MLLETLRSVVAKRHPDAYARQRLACLVRYHRPASQLQREQPAAGRDAVLGLHSPHCQQQV